MKQYKNITEVKNRVKELDRKTCKKYIQEARKEEFEKIIKELKYKYKNHHYTNPQKECRNGYMNKLNNSFKN